MRLINKEMPILYHDLYAFEHVTYYNAVGIKTWPQIL